MKLDANNLAQQLLEHALTLRLNDAGNEGDAASVAAIITFITDSVAVGLAGSRHPRLGQLRRAAAAWGSGQAAREWISGAPWPAASAAMLNAWMVHNQEFDCVHERAVVHPMATILPALVAQAERQAASGRELIEAVVVAVDVAATLGSAHIAPMRFFRPAMCGALGATLGLARLAGLNDEASANALGIAYSQLAGTMQAHSEGSPMLALQVGLASRAALMALDLASAGFAGPRDVIEGPFGYFNLFDAPLAERHDAVQAVVHELRTVRRVTQVSHKPYPTGRAAHGALDGLACLREAHGFAAASVARVELAAPPLILRLVGRPAHAAMDVNYARLCLPYLVATALLQGTVGLEDFEPAALVSAERLALAERVTWRPNGITDVNALAPQTLEVTLTSGELLTMDLPAVLGHPERPLSKTAQRAKFDASCAFAGMAAEQGAELHAACQSLGSCADVREFVALMRPRT